MLHRIALLAIAAPRRVLGVAALLMVGAAVFEPLQAHIPGLPVFTTYTDTTFSAEMNFYRVKLDTP